MIEDPAKPVAVHILDKDYRIGCPEGEEEQLLAAARLLDKRMKEIRTGGKVIGTERIAVMAAINLAHEVLSKQLAPTEQVDDADDRLRSLRERVEAALNESTQLEL